jgi:hypothetical protein
MDNLENEVVIEKKIPKLKKINTDEDIIQLTVKIYIKKYELNGLPHNT